MSNPTFGYSFDRDNYFGSYPTRQAALEAALQALKERSDVPEGIFIGQWIQPDVQSCGHAETIIESMRERWEASSESGNYLDQLNEHQIADLDASLNACIRDWLKRHQLMPAPTKLRAISEHPVPNVHHVPVPQHERETSLMGEA